ncbi:hypothetical protein N867_07250, partial [Actinotalea fermentans ATCC 43279 = JCM 9966 = DSM 3133]
LRAALARLGAVAPGLGVAAAIGVVAMAVGRLVPVVGGPVTAILLGIVVREVVGERAAVVPGARVAAKVVLQAAVVLLGAGLSLREVARTGTAALPVMLGTLTVALAGAALLGRWLRVDEETRTLVGVGTGICGASAIATVSAVIGASEAAVAYAVGTIVVFNVAGAVAFPLVGHALGMSQEGFGLWAGTAINDTSSVVAAGTVFGAAAASAAVVVKLTRTLLIVPVSVALAVRTRRRARATLDAGGTAGTDRVPWRRLVPPFLVLFLVAAALHSVGVVPAAWGPGISGGAHLLTAVALAGVGLLTSVASLRRAGWRPLLLGGLLSLAVATSSLALQAATGTL